MCPGPVAATRPAWNPRATTAAHMAARLKLYVACSGALDTTMPAIEKNSASAKNLQRLRSRIRKPMEKPPSASLSSAPSTTGTSPEGDALKGFKIVGLTFLERASTEP